jgi:hypothetical protein
MTQLERERTFAPGLDEMQGTAWRSSLGRLGGWLHSHRRVLTLSNVLAAGLFVLGCIGFYWPRFYVGSVTMFLIGSVLFLLSAVGSALLESGSVSNSRRGRRAGD